jgi:DNA-binding LytR/AlgR family response regulator
MKVRTKIVHLGSRKFLAADDIWYLNAKSNYTIVYTADGENFLSSTTLKIIEARLLSFKNFIRLNRQVVVNLDNTQKDADGNYILADGKLVTFSRRRARVNNGMVKPKKRGPKKGSKRVKKVVAE